MTAALDLQWREMRDEDRNYVLSSWLLSYSEAAEFRGLGRDVYTRGRAHAVYCGLYQPIIKQLVERSTVAVAYDPELPDTIIGWMAVEGDDVLHYVMVKPRFRKFGVAHWMTRDLAAMPAVYTHVPSPAAIRLIGDAWTYDPMRRFEKRAA